MNLAILLTDDFEDVEFRVPYDMLRNAGAHITVLGVTEGSNVTGKKKRETVTIEQSVADARPEDFDGLVIPGGYSPDKLRMSDHAVTFVRNINEAGKLIAAVCHGPQLMISADIVRGRNLTSWPSVAVDLRNAGANWSDEPVVKDGNFITSRKPDDLEQFSDAIISYLESRKAA